MIYLLAALLLGFLVTFLGTPYARRYLLASGIISIDQQKEGKPKLPASGGIVVLFGFMVSITSYLAFSAFLDLPDIDMAVTFAALNSAVLIALIGLLDDIHIDLGSFIQEELDIDDDDIEINEILEVERLPHQSIIDRFTGDFSGKDSDDVMRQGLGQVPKMLFVLPAVLPLMAVGAGSWTMHFPVIGAVNWGLVYPFILLPVGLFFVANVVNMLAGTNGLSAAMSLVASTALGTFAYMNGDLEAALIAFSLSTALVAFLRYNFYPASILPGDSLTYLCGAAMFAAIVIGNMEKFAVFIFAPWFLEFFLKLRSRFRAHSWGILQEDGTLKAQHRKNYSLTHPLMRRGFTEPQITLALAGMETLICVAGLILFSAGII
ncbi:MAG: hypothetical protein ABEI58_02990 [Candidatus Nanohaloarchaea archaeon]